MSRHLARAAFAAKLAILPFAPFAFADGAAPPLERLVPADVPVLVSFPGPKASAEAFKKLPVYATWIDPEIQTFLKSVRAEMPNRIAKLTDPSVGSVCDRLGDFPTVFDRQISVALLDAKRPTSRWCALLDGADAAKVAAFVASFEKAVFEPLFGLPPASIEYGGATIRVYAAGSIEMGVAVSGGTTIVGAPVSSVTAILDARAKPPAVALGDDPSHRALRGRLGADGTEMFSAIVNVGTLVAAGLEDEGESERRGAEAAGLLSLSRAGAAVRAEGALLRERVVLDFPEGRKGFFAAFSDNANKAGVARLAPAESLGAFAVNLKFRDLYRTILDVERAVSGGVPANEASLERSVEKEARLRVLGDFVDLLGEEAGVYVSLPASGGVIPDAGLFVEVLDPERFRRNLEEIAAKSLKLEFKTTEFRGKTVHYLQPDRRGNDFGIMFSYAVSDPFLLVSYFPVNVKNALARAEREDGTLASNARFRSVLASLPQDRKGFFFADTKRTLGYLYNLLTPFLQMENLFGLPYDPAALPTAEALTRHWGQTTGSLEASDRAVVAEFRSEGIGPASLVMYGTVAAGVLTPVLVGEARDRARNVCANTLRAARWTEDGREGVFPDNARRFIRGEVQPEGLTLACPADPRARKGEKNVVSFALFIGDEGEPLPDLSPQELIVAADAGPYHDGGRNVLRLDGIVEWLSEADFTERLERQKKATPAAEREEPK